ncbi:MAG: glycoside hydrolase family 5 protein [Bacteroidales bacterium]
MLSITSCSEKVESQASHLYVKGKSILTPEGDTVTLKGFNAMIVYWDIHGTVNFPEIEKTGANCVRIFWKLDYPAPKPSDLDKVLENCLKYHMIPIICLWDATGKWEKIQFCVDYWCSPQIVPILKKYEKYLIINIANEPGNTTMPGEVFRSTYKSAVEQIRKAGIHAPLIIDADNWGRNADSVLENGEYLVAQDPDKNLIFSWHLWDPYNYGTGTVEQIDRIINKSKTKNICFIVGEFGPCEQCNDCTGKRINWEFLMEKCYKNNIGYLPWVWKWSDCHSVVDNLTGTYGSWVNTPWGETVAVSGEYSIKKTASRPKIMN